MEVTNVTKRRLPISEMLKYLGISLLDYHAFLNHKPSASQQRKELIKEKIGEIYDDSPSPRIMGSPNHETPDPVR